MPPRLFLLRHGRSVANEHGLIVCNPANAAKGFGLTPAGREQVRATVAGARASGDLNPPVLLISSPLLRARESIEVAAEVLGSTPKIDPRLSERDFGNFELGPDDRYQRVWAKDRQDASHQMEGVESVFQVHTRAQLVVDELLHESRTASVILCTHGDVASILICSSLGVPLEQHREVGALGTGAMHELIGRVG